MLQLRKGLVDVVVRRVTKRWTVTIVPACPANPTAPGRIPPRSESDARGMKIRLPRSVLMTRWFELLWQRSIQAAFLSLAAVVATCEVRAEEQWETLDPVVDLDNTSVDSLRDDASEKSLAPTVRGRPNL